MIDGTSIMRTIVASTSTANASPSPNIFTSGVGLATNAPNTKIMMSAADVITRAVRERPRTTASTRVAARVVLLTDPREHEHLVVHRQAEQDGEHHHRDERHDGHRAARAR